MKKSVNKILIGVLCIIMFDSIACSREKEEKSVNFEGNEVVEQIKEPVSFVGSETAVSDLYVAPVEGLTDEFIRGVDVSSYVSEKDAGVVYQDFAGNELGDQDFFNFLADCGVNWVRIRVWNHPYNVDGMGYGGGNNDTQKAVVMGKLATNAGMSVLIDFHYSDFWADPTKQMVPDAWDHKSLADMEILIAEYTKDCLNQLIDAGVNVRMVQIGNEINNGLADETDPERVYSLLRSASSAIRGVSKDIQIAVHYANSEKSTFTDYAANLATAKLDYDVFGISYYPFWHGTLDNLESVMKTILGSYGKETIVMETSYAYTMEDGDGFANSIGEGAAGVEYPYEVSVQGQANSVRDVIQTVKNADGLGVFYWELAWIPVNVWVEDAEDADAVYEANKTAWEQYGCGWASSYSAKYDPDDAGLWYGGSSWDNQALFSFDGMPLESLNIFKYVFGGTTAKMSLSDVPNITYQSGIGKEVEMPTSVSAVMIDGSKKEIPVTWNTDQVTVAEQSGAGDYIIDGTATSDGQEFEVDCQLSIMKVNYIKNSGFEDVDMAMWTITGAGIERTKDNNKRTGDYSLKFWSEEKVVYTAEQVITNIPTGTYELSAFLQGGDAGSNALFELYIIVDGTEYKDGTSVSGWLKWDNPVISSIEIPEGATVVVGVRANAAAKAWGAWDDFTLYSMD